MKKTKILAGLIIVWLMCACGGGGPGITIGPLFNNPTITIDPCLAKVSPLNFGTATDAELNIVFTSIEVTVSGLGEGCTETISGYSNDDDETSRSFSINGGPFGLSSSTVRNGDRLRLRLISPSTYGSSTYWYALGASPFRVRSRPGRAIDAPVVSTLEPIDQSVVSARTTVVSGVAADPDGIASITVYTAGGPGSGYKATSTDGFATWQVTVALDTGSNEIRVSSTDALNNQNPVAAEITITNLLTVLENPEAMESDIANLRLLVVDQSLRALIAIDLASGQTTVLSDENTPDTANLFISPVKLVVNSSGSTAWLLDGGYEDIIQVDLATGLRTRLIDTANAGSPIPLSDAIDLVLDEINGRLLLANDEEETTQIVSLDLSSGARTVMSGANIPNRDTPFGVPKSLALDTISYRLLVLQRNTYDPARTGNAMLAVDPTTGQREVILDDSIVINFPIDTDVDVDGGRLLILSKSSRAEILAFDLATHELVTLFQTDSYSKQIARDPLQNRLLVLRSNTSSIYAIDMTTGEASIAY